MRSVLAPRREKNKKKHQKTFCNAEKKTQQKFRIVLFFLYYCLLSLSTEFRSAFTNSGIKKTMSGRLVLVWREEREREMELDTETERKRERERDTHGDWTRKAENGWEWKREKENRTKRPVDQESDWQHFQLFLLRSLWPIR